MKRLFNVRTVILGGLVTAAPFSFAADAGFEARRNAMGGTGVAAANYGSAALVNPALLAKSREGDGVRLTAPAVGAQVSDSSHLIDRFDDVNASWKKLESALGGPDVKAAAAEFNDTISGIAGSSATANVGVSMVLAVPDADTPVALFANIWGKGHARALVTQRDLDYLDGVSKGTIIPDKDSLDKLTSRAEGAVALVTEYGVAMAHPFTLGDIPFSFGFSPKLQRIETWNYNVSINNYSTDDFRNGDWQRQQITGNLDAGIYAELTPEWTLGLAAQNLIAQSIKTRTVNGIKNNFEMRPLVTAGAAWAREAVTLTADVDLSPASDFSRVDKSQYAGVGSEFGVTSWLDLRAGYRVDMRGNDHRMVTGGIGIAASQRVQFDLTAMAGRMRTLGGVAQLSYTF